MLILHENRSVNYIVKQDAARLRRIRCLMLYSFDCCFYYGKVYLSDNRKACALVLFPDKKKFSLRAAMLDLRLLFQAIGMANAGRALKREASIKSIKGIAPMYYLWYIGVDKSEQHKVNGSTLLSEPMSEATKMHRPVYLETSTESNLPCYKKFGFQIYNQLDFGYKLYFLKKG